MKQSTAHARAAAPGDVHTSPRHGAAPHSYPPAAAGQGSDPAAFSRHLESAAHHSESHVMWFNALIGRVAFDVFGNKKWAEFVQNRVQRKINKLKVGVTDGGGFRISPGRPVVGRLVVLTVRCRRFGAAFACEV